MVIGGGDWQHTNNNIEEIRTKSSLKNGCPAPNTFPVTIQGAVGANMSEDNQLLP